MLNIEKTTKYFFTNMMFYHASKVDNHAEFVFTNGNDIDEEVVNITVSLDDLKDISELLKEFINE